MQLNKTFVSLEALNCVRQVSDRLRAGHTIPT